MNGENVLFPSIAVSRLGVGAMAFSLSGPGFFPGAAYARFVLGRPVGAIPRWAATPPASHPPPSQPARPA